MGIAFVQTVGSAGSAANTTQVILTLSGVTTTVGNHLILANGSGGGSPISSIVDSQGNSWAVDRRAAVTTATEIASCKVVTPLVDGDTITVNYVASNGHGFGVFEFSGLHPTSWYEGGSGSGSGSNENASNSLFGPTVNGANRDELLIGATTGQVQMVAYTWEVLSPAWTNSTHVVGSSINATSDMYMAYRIVNVSGPYAAQGTWSSTARKWTSVCAAYRSVIPVEDIAFPLRTR